MLDLSIDQGGDGGDGYAIDFLTVGVTTNASSSTPEPGVLAMFGAGSVGAGGFLLRRRKRRQT